MTTWDAPKQWRQTDPNPPIAVLAARNRRIRSPQKTERFRRDSGSKDFSRFRILSWFETSSLWKDSSGHTLALSVLTLNPTVGIRPSISQQCFRTVQVRPGLSQNPTRHTATHGPWQAASSTEVCVQGGKSLPTCNNPLIVNPNPHAQQLVVEDGTSGHEWNYERDTGPVWEGMHKLRSGEVQVYLPKRWNRL